VADLDARGTVGSRGGGSWNELVENCRRGGNVAFGLPKLLGCGFSITCLAFAFLLSGGGLAADGFGGASAPALPAKVFADCAGSVV
jgi:hypothetical protein